MINDWLYVTSIQGLGALKIQKLLTIMSIKELRQHIEHQPDSLPLSEKMKQKLVPDISKIDQALAWAQQNPANNLVCFDDPNYPALLKQISDPPPILFVKGQLATLAIPAIALVGSRDASPTGLQIARQLASQLSAIGLQVCSGMAAGIDGAAHQSVIHCGGKTTAVLGCGVDVIYPNNHRNLYEQIQQHGCIVSEYWPATKPLSANFPPRNRIISGLSLGTVVVEAYRRSGSLITARLAMEQGREVFAVPGSILSGQNQGCHDLLRNGAKLVETAADIVEDLPSLYQYHLENSANPLENNTTKPYIAGNGSTGDNKVLSSIGFEVTPLDVIIERTNEPVNVILQELLELELQGKIADIHGGFIRIKN